MKPSNTYNFSDLKAAFEYKNDKELKLAHFIFSVINNPIISGFLQNTVKIAIFLRLPIKAFIKPTVFNHFCGGISIEDSQKTIEKIGEFNVKAILDYSVEGEKSERGFEAGKQEIIKTIRKASGEKNIPFTVFKMTGLASFDLLKKVQTDEILSPEEAEAYKRVKKRVDEVCSCAVENNVPIMIDSEETWIQDSIDEISYEMMRKYNIDKVRVLNTYQMYRKDSLSNLMEASQQFKKEGLWFGTKLVRGAYMEKERERAEKLGYDDPICADKSATDKSYDDGIRYCFSNRDFITVVNGTHNENSNALLASLIDENNLEKNDDRFWFAQLFGMSDQISFNLGKSGFNVAKYVPYGPVMKVMPYLLRRAEENTSVAGQSSRELMMIKEEIRRRRS